MSNVETHPIENSFIPENAKAIVVGTFPPRSVYENNSDFFFYGSVRNHFWNRMENIFSGIELKKTTSKCVGISPAQNKKDKEDFSIEKKIGFIDVFTKITRTNDSSDDSDLNCIEDIIDNRRFFQILEKNTTINRFCCVYTLAYTHFKNKLNKNNYKIVADQNTANGEKILYNYNGRQIEIMLLYAATRSREKKELKDEQYKKLLFNF